MWVKIIRDVTKGILATSTEVTLEMYIRTQKAILRRKMAALYTDKVESGRIFSEKQIKCSKSEINKQYTDDMKLKGPATKRYVQVFT